jgi:hypothetical protein
LVCRQPQPAGWQCYGHGRVYHRYAKPNPRKISMASFGSGSASHLAGELFKMTAGVDLVHV